MDMLKSIGINYLIMIVPILLLSGLFYIIIMNIQKQLFELMGGFAMILIYPCVILHELAHMIMAIIFTHRVEEVKLFKFNISDGVLGYVTTTKPRSRFKLRTLYMNIGDFFVGIAPVLLGGVGLVYLTNLLDKKYFEKVLENPNNFLSLNATVIVVMIAFSFSMLFLSDLDFKAILRGFPFLTITLLVYLSIITYFSSLNFLLVKSMSLQINVIIILAVTVLISIIVLITLVVMNFIKRLFY